MPRVAHATRSTRILRVPTSPMGWKPTPPVARASCACPLCPWAGSPCHPEHPQVLLDGLVDHAVRADVPRAVPALERLEDADGLGVVQQAGVVAQAHELGRLRLQNGMVEKRQVEGPCDGVGDHHRKEHQRRQGTASPCGGTPGASAEPACACWATPLPYRHGFYVRRGDVRNRPGGFRLPPRPDRTHFGSRRPTPPPPRRQDRTNPGSSRFPILTHSGRAARREWRSRQWLRPRRW